MGRGVVQVEGGPPGLPRGKQAMESSLAKLHCGPLGGEEIWHGSLLTRTLTAFSSQHHSSIRSV